MERAQGGRIFCVSHTFDISWHARVIRHKAASRDQSARTPPRAGPAAVTLDKTAHVLLESPF